MFGFRRIRHRQNRISSAERIRHGLARTRIANPIAIHDEAVFVGAGRKIGFLPPVARAGGMQCLRFRFPLVKTARDANGLGRRMRELEAHRHELRAGGVVVVVIVIVFHGDNLFRRGGSADLRHMDVARMIDDAEHGQQPHDDTNHHDDVENFFDFSVHRNVGIDEPEQHTDDDEGDNEIN